MNAKLAVKREQMLSVLRLIGGRRFNWRVMVVMAALALSPTSAWAWGELGHRVVCDVAWKELSPAARDQVQKLLQQAGKRTFAEACLWPDQVRSEKEFKHTGSYHYVNVERAATEVSTAKDCQSKGCVLTALNAYADALIGKPHPDYQATPAQALMFIGHFIGDIHQPLHVSYGDDRGGNKVVYNVAGEETNLHRLWDVNIPESGLPRDWRKAGKKVRGKHRGEAVTALTLQDAESWANESLAITRKVYASLPKQGSEWSKKELAREYPVAEMRLYQAGVRLGAVLNQLLAPNQDQTPAD
ncbi:S1/P1 nuclease [Hahella sp. HN01]|uniref:S1/P1 nuclease n=1 Tax=Hahella sp. HN01 TaxID=2847262 RepID=UPI001C1F19CE|nr:S1/P1 nuclease [Hahella sp. HN01]MBU6953197.1 S1/P1 nuclease [Hahella sp. HN01]